MDRHTTQNLCATFTREEGMERRRGLKAATNKSRFESADALALTLGNKQSAKVYRLCTSFTGCESTARGRRCMLKAKDHLSPCSSPGLFVFIFVACCFMGCTSTYLKLYTGLRVVSFEARGVLSHLLFLSTR